MASITIIGNPSTTNNTLKVQFNTDILNITNIQISNDGGVNYIDASSFTSTQASFDVSSWENGTYSNCYLKIIYEENQEIACTGITINKSSLSFTSSSSQTLTATLTPSNTTDALTWSTNNGSVATVASGVVTPVGNGSCTITATCGTKSASCSVNVNIAAAPTTYTITKNLSNCTINNSSSSITANSSYSATISANTDYTMSSIAVTMGGTDITSSTVSGNSINISSVTGNIVITASATANSSGGDTEDVYTFGSPQMLFDLEYNYDIWNSDCLQYDSTINKYVFLGTTYDGTNAHMYQVLIDPDTLACSTPQLVSFDDFDNGSWVQNPSFKILSDGTYWTCYEQAVYLSTDKGITWNFQYMCNNTLSWKALWEATELSNGWIIASKDEYGVKFRLTKDRGKTWTTVAPPNYDSIAGNFKGEATFLELEPGYVMCIARQYETNAGWENVGTAPHKALITYSTDYGETWSDFRLSSTIEMSDSSGGGFVRNGVVHLFTNNRWYPAYGLGKGGAVKYYKASIEDAKNDNFTEMGILAYSNCSTADGGHASGRYNCLCNAMDSNGNILLSYYDRPANANTLGDNITYFYFVKGTLGQTQVIECTNLTLDKSTLTFTSSSTQTLTATKTPSNTTQSVTWSTSSSSVATVSNGVVTPVGNGSCTITATCGSRTATCSVTVNIATQVVDAGLLGDLSTRQVDEVYPSNANPTVNTTSNSVEIVPSSSSNVSIYYYVGGLSASTTYTLTLTALSGAPWVEVYALDGNGNYIDDSTALAEGKGTSYTFTGYTQYSIGFCATNNSTCKYEGIKMS